MNQASDWGTGRETELLIVMQLSNKQKQSGREKKVCGRAKGIRRENNQHLWVNDNFPLSGQKTESRPSHDVFIALAGVTECLP